MQRIEAAQGRAEAAEPVSRELIVAPVQSDTGIQGAVQVGQELSHDALGSVTRELAASRLA